MSTSPVRIPPGTVVWIGVEENGNIEIKARLVKHPDYLEVVLKFLIRPHESLGEVPDHERQYDVEILNALTDELITELLLKRSELQRGHVIMLGELQAANEQLEAAKPIVDQHEKTVQALREGHRERYGDPDERTIEVHRLYNKVSRENPDAKKETLLAIVAKELGIHSNTVRNHLSKSPTSL